MELHLPNIHYFKADLSKFNITNSAGEVGHINDCSNCRNKINVQFITRKYVVRKFGKMKVMV